MENGNCPQGKNLAMEEMDGEKRITKSMIVCGDNPQHLVSETNKVVVRYRFLDGVPPADQSFSFHYNAVGSRCDETIRAIQSVLQTPGYPQGTKTFTHCVWLLEVPKGQRVRLEMSSDIFTTENHFTIANDHQFRFLLWS